MMMKPVVEVQRDVIKMGHDRVDNAMFYYTDNIRCWVSGAKNETNTYENTLGRARPPLNECFNICMSFGATEKAPFGGVFP
jgi:hypothetical protein